MTRTALFTALLAASTTVGAWTPTDIACVGNAETLHRVLGFMSGPLAKCEPAPSPMNPHCGALATFAEIADDGQMIQKFAACQDAGIETGPLTDELMRILTEERLEERLNAVAGALQ